MKNKIKNIGKMFGVEILIFGGTKETRKRVIEEIGSNDYMFTYGKPNGRTDSWLKKK